MFSISWHVSDVDECNQDVCHPNATCTNFEASYLCECNGGFLGDGFYCNGTVIANELSIVWLTYVNWNTLYSEYVSVSPNYHLNVFNIFNR